MNENNSKQIKIGAIISYLQIFIGIAIQVLYTPFMLDKLGKNEYGLYQTVASTINVLNFLHLGFNSSYLRFFSKYKKNNDVDSISRLNGLFIIIFSILGSVALIIGIFLTFNLTLVFDTGLTVSEYEKAKWLMLILTINITLTFPASVFTCIISANQKYIFLKILTLIKNVASHLLVVPCLLLGFGSISIVGVSLIVSIIIDLLYLYFVLFKLKQKFIFTDFQKGLFKDLLVFTSFIAINLVVDQINSSMGKVLLGRLCGTGTVAVYSIGFTLFSFYVTFASCLNGLFAPKVYSIINNTDNDLPKQRLELTSILTKVGRIQFIILALLSTGVLIFGQPFIKIWAGDGFEDSYYVALILMFPATIPYIQTLGVDVQRAKNQHKFRSFSYLIMAIVNIFIVYILAPKYGAIGAAVGTGISFLVANGIIINFYYHFKCNLDIIVFWKSILRISLGTVIPICFGLVLNRYIDFYALWKLLLCIAIYTLIYFVSLWFISFNKEEKQGVIQLFKKLKLRKNNNAK